jgi:carbon-monoxide dehydrogenase medium subunit
VEAAIALLGEGGGYQCLAGGGLILPGMRGGSRPSGLVSLRQIGVLRGIARQADGTVRIGAMTSHADVMACATLVGGHALVRLAAAEIAHPVIRNMATLGGTLARADPSADYSCALLAAGAEVHMQASDGVRVVAIDDFTLGDGATVLRYDELIIAVTLPADVSLGSSGYARFSRVDGDYPAVTAAVRLVWADGAVVNSRIAIGGCADRAYRVEAAEQFLHGSRRIEDAPEAAYEACVAMARPIDDVRGSATYRRMLIPGLLRRALKQAFAAKGAGR